MLAIHLLPHCPTAPECKFRNSKFEIRNSTPSLPHCLTASLPLFLLLACLLLPQRAAADAIVMTRAMTATTIAEFFIEDNHVRVELEIGLRDLDAFRNLTPDAIYERLGHEPRPLAERIPEFFRQDLVLRADGGDPLPGRVREMAPRPRIRRDEISGEPLPAVEEEPETIVFAVLEYLLPGRPQSLSMRPPKTERGVTGAEIGFVTYHRGLPVNDFRYLGTEETVRLDWEDPWYSRFDNRNLRRQYNAPMSAFLYVEPYEVRIEIIARPVDLEQWIDLGLKGRETIPVEIQQDLKQKVVKFLAEHSTVTVEGKPVKPIPDRIHFLRRTLRTSTVIDPPQELDALSATLGVIYVHPTVGLPEEATLTWELFPAKMQRVRAAATDEAGPLPYILMPDDNVLRWQNFLKNPTLPTLVTIDAPPRWQARTISIGGWLAGLIVLLTVLTQAWRVARGRDLASRALWASPVLLAVAISSLVWARTLTVTNDRAQEILTGLLHNVYRAFDFRDESMIYDVLDRSVTGELLTQIYLETRRGLELASQGGARAKVKKIEMLNVEAEPVGGEVGFIARSTWNVTGSVGHWGHIHQRTNQYLAEMTVKPVDGVWKITELELLQEERL